MQERGRPSAGVAPELPQAAGLFGRHDSLPLVSDLLPGEIVDATVYGYQSIHPGVVAGLVQNDGRIFPELSEGRERTLLVDALECGRRRSRW